MSIYFLCKQYWRAERESWHRGWPALVSSPHRIWVSNGGWKQNQGEMTVLRCSQVRESSGWNEGMREKEKDEPESFREKGMFWWKWRHRVGDQARRKPLALMKTDHCLDICVLGGGGGGDDKTNPTALEEARLCQPAAAGAEGLLPTFQWGEI